MTILEEAENELEVELREDLRNILKARIETRRRMFIKYVAAKKEVDELASMTLEEYRDWSTVHSRHMI